MNDLVGSPISAIPTPALLVEREALERNLRNLAAFFAGRPCRPRPHFKSHKCVEIARLQLTGGATGITCAKLAEAKVLVRGGVQPGPETLALAETVRAMPGLRFDGLQGYEGHVVVLPDAEESRRRALEAVGLLAPNQA